MPEDYVSMDLFEERTRHIQESIADIKHDIQLVRTDLKVIPELRSKVAEHERNWERLKTWGLRALIFLAGGGAVGALTLTDVLRIIGLKE